MSTGQFQRTAMWRTVMEGDEIEEIDDQDQADNLGVSIGWMMWFSLPGSNGGTVRACYDLTHELDEARDFATTYGGRVRITIEVEAEPGS